MFLVRGNAGFISSTVVVPFGDYLVGTTKSSLNGSKRESLMPDALVVLTTTITLHGFLG